MNSAAIEYRKIKPNESKTYRTIRLESLKQYPYSFGSRYEYQKELSKLAFEAFIEAVDPEKFIVGAFYQDQLVGICGFVREGDDRCRHRGKIIQMYVQKEYQGNNIGFKLLQKTIEVAFEIEELEQIELGVITNVKAACKIYEKAGFQESGLEKHLFKVDGEYLDHRLMVLFRENQASL